MLRNSTSSMGAATTCSGSPHVSEVVRALVRWAIGADYATAVKQKTTCKFWIATSWMTWS